jgi:hypothetical protein
LGAQLFVRIRLSIRRRNGMCPHGGGTCAGHSGFHGTNRVGLMNTEMRSGSRRV